jgi:predicted metal-dependent HD superfamily phosphohydrolase
MRLKRRWLAFCRRAGAAGREEEAFADLDRHYREPGRHYHTWAHVTACLRELRRARPPSGGPQALELALWFHDVVCEAGRGDNEEASAALVLRWAGALGLSPELGRRAAGLILSTRHAQAAGRASPFVPAEDSTEGLLRDIDLAVLGAGRARYLRYERGIAREYSGLPPEQFREGRAELLRGFLARPALYATPSFRRRLERRARRNLARALAGLERAGR